jgi:DNA-binding IclR family transcriptional regulator
VATPKNYSVIKAFEILKAFRDAEGWLSSCELSRRANLPQASGYRLIQTMEKIGVIAKGKRGQYRPGMLLLSISRGVPLLYLLREAGKPILTNLAVSLDLTAHLAVLENGTITCIEKYRAATAVPLPTRVGAQSEPCNATLGKVLLAGLDRSEVETLVMGGRLTALTPFTASSSLRLHEELQVVRKHGFAIHDRGPHVKTWCLAVPVQDSHGRTIAAISASREARLMTPSREGQIELALFQAAARLQNDLYHTGPSENCLSRGEGRRTAKNLAKPRVAGRRGAHSLREPGPGQELCQATQSD